MISRRKVLYEPSPALNQYLSQYRRRFDIPLVYDELFRFTGSIPYEDPKGNETLWLQVMYSPEVMQELRPMLTKIYATLKIGGDLSVTEHLTVERIDFGEFGNSRPFRIRITNQFNGNSDYYYVKKADASRLYGLELEHILSPNRINYLVNENTLIEEHIPGVPGNTFISEYLHHDHLNKVRVAKEFVKFAERSFIRLLGDMRTVNYVVDITPDFEEIQYRVRAIDFDQQSYERKIEVYYSHFFEDNFPVRDMAFSFLNEMTINQYRVEERSQMSRRAKSEHTRLTGLLSTMRKEILAPEEHVVELKKSLGEYHQISAFESCRSMGDLTATQIHLLLEDNKNYVRPL